MYISLMAMQQDGFIKTMDSEKHYRRDFKHIIEAGKRLDTFHTPFQLRQEIIKAAKVVVGLDIMNMSLKPSLIHPAEHVWGKKAVSDEYKESKRAMYAQFARMPFNVLFIENWTGAHLVTRNPDGVTWTQITLIHCYDPDLKLDYAMSTANKIVVDPRTVDADGYISTQSIPSATFARVVEKGDGEIARSQARVYATQVAETLMFLNVKNATPQRYKATKADMRGSKIPKVFEPYFDYRILDIYRKNEPIKDIKDLTDRVINQIKNERADSRAHLVRGHFKTINNSLFWWNPFMRNRQRLETHGFVDKDYRLNT